MWQRSPCAVLNYSLQIVRRHLILIITCTPNRLHSFVFEICSYISSLIRCVTVPDNRCILYHFQFFNIEGEWFASQHWKCKCLFKFLNCCRRQGWSPWYPGSRCGPRPRYPRRFALPRTPWPGAIAPQTSRCGFTPEPKPASNFLAVLELFSHARTDCKTRNLRFMLAYERIPRVRTGTWRLAPNELNTMEVFDEMPTGSP
jgi:hypothetical protein